VDSGHSEGRGWGLHVHAFLGLRREEKALESFEFHRHRVIE
jgi:hypothetical protein